MNTLTLRNRGSGVFLEDGKAASDNAITFLPTSDFDVIGHICKHHQTLRVPQTFSLETSQLSRPSPATLSPDWALLYGREKAVFLLL